MSKIKTAIAVNIYFAEDVGFEPTEPIKVRRFSKPLLSATQPILRIYVSQKTWRQSILTFCLE
jgi:hypothetical protein